MSPNDKARELLAKCVDDLRTGRLTEKALDDVAAALDGDGRHQDLLYLQTHGTSPVSDAIGMLMVVDGKIEQGPEKYEDWPYHKVVDALRDGWRVISFPNLALLAHDEATYGLGCEFILERWR